MTSPEANTSGGRDSGSFWKVRGCTFGFRLAASLKLFCLKGLLFIKYFKVFIWLVVRQWWDKWLRICSRGQSSPVKALRQISFFHCVTVFTSFDSIPVPVAAPHSQDLKMWWFKQKWQALIDFLSAGTLLISESMGKELDHLKIFSQDLFWSGLPWPLRSGNLCK